MLERLPHHRPRESCQLSPQSHRVHLWVFLKILSSFYFYCISNINFIKHSLISFSNLLATDSSITSSNWCECSSKRRVNKLLSHPILIDAPSVQTEINFFSTLSFIQCSLIKLKYLSRQTLNPFALAGTSWTSNRFSSLVTVAFHPFMNSSL